MGGTFSKGKTRDGRKREKEGVLGRSPLYGVGGTESTEGLRKKNKK